MIVIDGTNQILGRLAGYVAKQSLLGETIEVVNCNKIVISGSKKVTLARAKKFREMGVQPKKGPFQPRMPDRFVRKVIKRMLPMKKPRGQEAFHRVMCHINVPEKFKNIELISLKQADFSRLGTLKYVTVHEICRELGAKL